MTQDPDGATVPDDASRPTLRVSNITMAFIAIHGSSFLFFKKKKKKNVEGPHSGVNKDRVKILTRVLCTYYCDSSFVF
jgi:hypothetical protein